MGTLVSVGNATQPFPRLLGAIAAMADRLPQPVVIQSGYTSFQCGGCDMRPFLEMSAFETLVTEANLLILHAGAGSVIHALRAGKVPVLMPRRAALGEHVDDHQIEFARELEKMGRVSVAYESRELEGAVARALAMQKDPIASRVSPMVGLVAETLDRYARLSAQ